ncbi:MAG: hypothetical protein WB763_19125 [Terriglobia bacterium]|jgi:hypothetical protein
MKGGSRNASHGGLNLPGRVRRQLREVGILARTEVGLEHQHLAGRYVIRGVESGGAIREMGHYVTFSGEDGEPLPYLYPIDAIGVNGVHAVVVAPVLVRVEMLRTGRTYELLITSYRIGEAENGRRPPLESQTLFRGVHGYLELELWGKNRESAGLVIPAFYSRGGEHLEVPAKFEPVTRAITKAVACCGCSHGHYLVAEPDVS